MGTNGIVQANNTLDPHYVITAAAQGTVGAQATVILNHPAWLANDANSAFIGVLDPGAANVAAGNYNYRTAFSLDGFIVGTVQINTGLGVITGIKDLVLS